MVEVIQGAEPLVKALGRLADAIDDDQERMAVRRQIAQVMIAYVDLLETITAQFPDLEPEPEVRGGDIIVGEREQ